MDIVGIFTESLEISKKNLLVFLPTAAAAVATALLTFVVIGTGLLSAALGAGFGSPTALVSAIGAMMGGVFLVGIVAALLGLAAHGMTVAMAAEAVDRGTTSLSSGLSITLNRLGGLIVAALLTGIIIGLGFLLFFIPGLIALFFLMFTFVLIIVEDLSAIEAMKRSYALARQHLNDAVVFFVGGILAGCAVAAVNMVLGAIPVLGHLAGMVLMGCFGGYMTVALVLFYRKLTAPASPSAGSASQLPF